MNHSKGKREFQRREGVKILTELFLRIEEAETIGDNANDCFEAICELSRHYQATVTLLEQFKFAVLSQEQHWQDIERREDFKAQFANRTSARKEFLREYFAGKKSRS